MQFDDIMEAVLNIFPDAELAEDLDGQLIVYTGFELASSDDVWVPMEEGKE
jgi:hypothetical protein